MANTTEQSSNHQDLDQKSINDLLTAINQEDQTVPIAIEKVIPNIEHLVQEIVPKMKQGGRLFYIGAGTSGRLGIVDASECPPTFGVPHDLVIGVMAGGDQAIRKAVEFAEDDKDQGWEDLSVFQPNSKDTIIGIAASGKTPYVVGTLQKAQKNQIMTACITCNSDTPLAQVSDHPIEAIVGPEFVTGSTRMKAGTAQKLILNMISTTVMIQLGKVKGNKMVDMQLSNTKLVDRGTRMIMEETSLSYEEAKAKLLEYGSVRKAVDSLS